MRHHRASLGLHPLAPLHDDHAQHGRQDLFWSRVRVTFREPFAEFWGVVIMILFGNGSVAQVLLSTGQTEGAPGGNGFGNYQNVNWGYASPYRFSSMVLTKIADGLWVSCSASTSLATVVPT